MPQSDYKKYRGKCKEFVDKAIKNDPTLKAVRGYYYCPFWGKQQHWWCVRLDGSIYDPTVRQFPSKGLGEYIEFDGNIICEYCKKQIKEEDAYFNGNHAYCSYNCAYNDVM